MLRLITISAILLLLAGCSKYYPHGRWGYFYMPIKYQHIKLTESIEDSNDDTVTVGLHLTTGEDSFLYTDVSGQKWWIIYYNPPQSSFDSTEIGFGCRGCCKGCVNDTSKSN